MVMLFIDSAHRNNGTSSEFSMDLSHMSNSVFRNQPTEVYFVRCSVPYSFYNIRPNVNNQFTVTYSNSSTEVIYLSGSPTASGNIPIATILANLKAQMDTNTSSQTFTITISTITGKVTFISNAGQFTLSNFDLSQEILGFAKNTSYTSVTQILTSPYVGNENYERNIQIRTNLQFDSNDYDSFTGSQSTSILTTIPVTGALVTKFSNIYYEEINPNRKIVNVVPHKLNIRLTYSDGSIVDLNGKDWSFQIMIDKI